MNNDRPAEYLVSLVRELCKRPQETEWVELKVSHADAMEIGEQMSALANSAALVGKAFAYLAWGVANIDRAIVGTSFAPRRAKMGNEELENWFCACFHPRSTSASSRWW